MNHEDTSSSHGFSWPESLGPMPEAVRSLENYRHYWNLPDWPVIDAAFEALKKKLFFVGIAWEKSKARAEQAEAEVADLNRVLEAGREEYELAVAEMNRRGEEVAGLAASRNRWRYLAEKGAWCLREGMFLLGNHNPNSGSWFPYHIQERWERYWGESRRERHDLAARYERRQP